MSHTVRASLFFLLIKSALYNTPGSSFRSGGHKPLHNTTSALLGCKGLVENKAALQRTVCFHCAWLSTVIGLRNILISSPGLRSYSLHMKQYQEVRVNGTDTFEGIVSLQLRHITGNWRMSLYNLSLGIEVLLFFTYPWTSFSDSDKTHIEGICNMAIQDDCTHRYVSSLWPRYLQRQKTTRLDIKMEQKKAQTINPESHHRQRRLCSSRMPLSKVTDTVGPGR